VYQKVSGQALPAEPYKLAIAICGPRNKPFWVEDASGKNNLNFYDLKGIVEGLASGVHLEKVSFKPGNHPALHPGKCAALLIRDKVAGMFGVLHPKLASTLGLDNHEIIAAEFDLLTLASGLPVRYLSKPVSRFPAALRDIAVVVDQSITGQTVTAEIQAAGGNVLKVARLFDIYQGDRVPTGTKSLAFALSYQADDRTLNDKEVDKLHKKIEDRLKHVLKAQIRGKEV
jgi:phenylalanyl-tRNA synthetase beta chain